MNSQHVNVGESKWQWEAMCAHNNFPQLGKMNRSLLWMRCQSVGDVLCRESPAVDVADLESALYYVFMKEQHDCRFIIHWTWWEGFVFRFHRCVIGRWKCVRRFTVKHHHHRPDISLHKLFRNWEQSHKCTFSLDIEALLCTYLIWIWFCLCRSCCFIALVVKFDPLKNSFLLLIVVLGCLFVNKYKFRTFRLWLKFTNIFFCYNNTFII